GLPAADYLPCSIVPFLNDYSIGILHALIFLSMIVTPMIYHKIFSRLSVDVVPAILISFAISILTPQFIKLHSGHYALIYACIFPLILLLTLKYLQERTVKSVWLLFVYN